jgi:hypothetical protein
VTEHGLAGRAVAVKPAGLSKPRLRRSTEEFMFISNPSKHKDTHIRHILQHYKTLHSAIQCICVFRMVLTINSDCFPKKH